MQTLGSQLRSQRERLGLPLEDLAQRTKIRASYLAAIEADRLDDIPGGFFSRSFVRQYASALGIPEEQVEQRLAAVTEDPRETVPVERVMAEYRKPAQRMTFDESGLEGVEYSHEAVFVRDRTSVQRWVAVAILLAVGSGGYLAWRSQPELFASVARVFAKGPSQPATVAQETPAAPVQRAVQPVLVQTSSPAPEAPAVQPAPTMTPSPLTATAAPATQPVDVLITASELTWVRLSVDGQRVYGGTIEAGQQRRLTANASAVIFTGNAGGINVHYQGKSIGSLGPRGQVRTVFFTPETFEIRLPMPAGAPAATGAPGVPSTGSPGAGGV